MNDDNDISGTISNMKCEFDSDDTELAAKRSKISECLEKEEENQYGCEEVKTSPLMLIEKNDDYHTESVNVGILGDNQSVKENVLSDEKSSILVIKLPCTIEADAAEDNGSRHTMEDASVILLDASLQAPGKLRCAHFAIYDGHGGRLAAEYAQKHFHANFLSAGLPRGCMH
ncbi:hypothetical protein MKX01_021750 [Papaver californicum]|nr:hypothetical protein MKX01_021750 [Papaver californicum]